MPFICQLETNEKTMKEKKGVQNMLVDISNKNLDMLENVKQIMVKGKITQSLSLFGVKRCQKRERVSIFVAVFNNNVLWSNYYLRQHWSK